MRGTHPTATSNPNGFVVLTDLMETKTKDNSQAPVIVALNIKPKKRGLELISISSAYGKQKNWFINQFENNALFVDTAKGQNFLNTHNLQLGWDFTSGSALSARNIKTESDLSQYKQQNTAQNSRVSEPLQSSDRATPQQIAAYKTAISASLKNHAHLINVVSRDDLVRPENAEKLQGVEGFYNPSNGQITLITESLRSLAHAQFVAWHELAHRKIDVSGAKDWQSAIAQAAKHETVRKLADKIQEQRKNTDDPAATNRAIAHEEAIAELYAAHETGDYAALKEKYDIKIPRVIQNNLGGFLARLGDKLASIVKRALGLNVDNHAQVYDLLRNLSRADASGSLKNSTGVIRNSKLQNIQAQGIDEQAEILQGEPVSVIDEQELDLPLQGGFQAVTQWASDLFTQQGNVAENPLLGQIELNERSVKDSLAHGRLNPYKNMAFVAVKDVLEKGALIAKDANQFKENSYYVSAPILMNGKENILTVTVREDSTTRRMYLHSVMLKENLLTPRVSSTLEKTSRTHSGSLTSADIHNILQKALTYKPENSGSLKFSRGTTKDQIAQFAQTGKIEQDLGLIEALKNDRTAEYLSGKKSSLKTTAFLFDI